MQFVAVFSKTRGLTIPGQSSVLILTADLLDSFRCGACRSTRDPKGWTSGPSKVRISSRSRDGLTVLVKNNSWMSMSREISVSLQQNVSDRICIKIPYHRYIGIWWLTTVQPHVNSLVSNIEWHALLDSSDSRDGPMYGSRIVKCQDFELWGSSKPPEWEIWSIFDAPLWVKKGSFRGDFRAINGSHPEFVGPLWPFFSISLKRSPFFEENHRGVIKWPVKLFFTSHFMTLDFLYEEIEAPRAMLEEAQTQLWVWAQIPALWANNLQFR